MFKIMYKVHLGVPDMCTILDGHMCTLNIQKNVQGTLGCA